ncbi:PREDICTED: very-long-chain 3-oxoacyl-CoA reductase-like protein At1g24470 [Tarenaya hassleriana]|uniref:very-long-chain 3-oxoacyl-CoA reductase-like protein At1g24470 n=1 Tax=Tarenaya hassleriana TaxID=28532 RepID=UPI00053C67C6|nr:PREDICTED: very-long-chain 3-oxoacyl-CoA reductase-like protein At1g24470 [Tarenaya hassleriana]
MQTTCSEKQPWHLHLVLDLVCLIGFVSLLKLSSRLFDWVFTRFVLHPKPLKSYGSWALVTGATAGIGRAFAHELAKHGLNLILVSRNPTKLESVAQQFHQEFPNTKIKIIPFDFSSEEEPSTRYKAIEEAIKGVDVGILINNVGITYPKAMFFHEVEEETWKEIIRVNVEGTTWVTRHVIGGMLQRRRGAIVNISSGAGVVVSSHPLYAIYAATKCYIDTLSKCLHVEYKQFGIDVHCQVPLYVATGMVSKVANVDGPSLFTPSPEMYAKAAIGMIGIRPRCSPFWAHSLQWFLVQLLPEFVVDSWRLSIGLRRRNLIF